MSDGWLTTVWSPEHDQAGRQVQRYLETSSGPVVLTAADAWRWSMCLMSDAEYNLALCQQLRGGAHDTRSWMVGPDRSARNAAEAVSGIWPAYPEAGRFSPIDYGEAPKLLYLGPFGMVRDIYRSSRGVSKEPTFRSFGAPEPVVGDMMMAPLGPLNRVPGAAAIAPFWSNFQGASALRLGPVAAIVLGVVAVAALASAGYVGGEYVKKNVEVDAEKARIAAEASLKSQIALAQMAQGKPVALDDLTLSAGHAEERSGWFAPVAVGGTVVVAGAAGVLGWRLGRRKTL